VGIQYLMGAASGRSPDLFVATTSGSTPKPNYVDSMARTIKAATAAGIELEWLLHQGDPHVDDSRNACVAKFLEGNAPRFMFIDDDVGWDEYEFLKFIKHDRDVVAAIYPKKKDEPDWPVRFLPGIQQAEADGLLQVENVPTGFLMIKRHVLESMAAEAVHFKRKDTGTTPLLFERGLIGDARWSGDYWWGRKWAERGGTIWIDPEMTLTHVGFKTWSGHLGDWLRQKNGILDPLTDKTYRLLMSGITRPEIFEVLVGRSGNWPWCAEPTFLAKAYEMAKEAKGPVLECGSGLSTIVMGITGAEVHTLEHDLSWLKKTQAWLDRYGLKNVFLHYAPLREHDDGIWYETPDMLPAMGFALAVCDGPPRNIANRRLFWRCLFPEISGADWLIDDVAGDASFYEQNGRKAELIDRFAVVRRTNG
jgi:hypothetical protein